MAKISTVNNILKDIREKAMTVAEPITIEQCYLRLQSDPALRPLVRAFHRGEIQDDWDILVTNDEVVIFAVMPAGGDNAVGKQIMGAIAMIAIMIYAPYLAGFAAEGLMANTALSVAAVNAIELGITAGIGIVGSLAVSAVFRPPMEGLNGPVSANMADNGAAAVANPLIVGQSNSAKPGGIIPVYFGQHTIFPDLAGLPYVEKAACKQTLHAIYCLGAGEIIAPQEGIRFGGIPMRDINEQNGDQYGLIKTVVTPVTGPGSYYGALVWGYKGRRDVKNVGLVINPPSDTGVLSPVIATVVRHSKRVYLDVVYGAGIYDVDNYTGAIIEHTAFLTVQKKVNGSWTNISMEDVSDGYETGLVCADEGIQGIVTAVTTEVTTWSKFKEIVREAVTPESSTSAESVDIIYPTNICCGANSADVVRGRGWNVGVQQAGVTGELACGSANDTNCIPYERFKHRLNNTLKDGALYYSFRPKSFATMDDGKGFFANGVVSISAFLWYPINYADKSDLSNMRVKFYATGYKADGSSKQLAYRDALMSTGGTKTVLTLNFGTSASFQYVKIVVGVTIPHISGVHPALTVSSMSGTFTPAIDSSVPMPEDQNSIIRIKVPVPTPGGVDPAFSQPKPVKDDVVYFANAQPDSCVNDCYDLGITYPTNIFDTWFPASKYKGIPGTKHVVVEVGPGTSEQGNSNQHWMVYDVTLDGPVGTSPDIVYVMRLYKPGFSVRARYQAAIHLGIMLDAAGVTEFKIVKEVATHGHQQERAVLASVSCIADGLPIVNVSEGNTNKITLLEIAVPASDAIGTTLQPLSITVDRPVRDFSEASYDIDLMHGRDYQKSAVGDTSSNPAWAYLNVIFGAPGGRPLKIGDKEYLRNYVDLEAFRRWAKMCEDQYFYFTYIVSGYSTIGSLLSMIAAAGRAKPTFRDGRHSILFDGDPVYFTGTVADGDVKPIVRQLITPENSWNGSSNMTYVADVHALKVLYTDVIARQQKQVIVYAPGFAKKGTDFAAGDDPDSNSGKWKAEKIETLSLPGVGNWTQAGMLGFYYMEEVRLRRERVSRTMDVEGLISLEGDIVGVASDVMKLGGYPVRVNEVVGVTATKDVTLDSPMPNMLNTVVRLRYFDTANKQPKVTEQLAATVDPYSTGDHSLIQFTVPAGVEVETGQLLIWGTTDRVTQDYQIVSMKFSADMTVTLEMLEYYADPLNYHGDRVTVGNTNPKDGEVDKPEGLTLNIKWTLAGEGKGWILQYFADWEPVKSAVTYKIHFTDALRWAMTPATNFITNARIVGCEHKGGTMGVEVIAVDSFGNQSPPATATVHNTLPIVVPPDVVSFAIDVKLDGSILTWVTPLGEHITGFEIRWSEDPKATPDWLVNTEILYSGVAINSLETDHRRGIFYIKTLGPCGVMSVTSAFVISDVITSPVLSEKERTTFYGSGLGKPPVSLEGCVDTTDSAGVVHTTCNLMQNKVKIGTTYDLAMLPHYAPQSGLGLKTDRTNYVHESGHSAASGPCFREVGWIYLNPDFGANAISRDDEVVLSSHVWGMGVELGLCPKPPPPKAITGSVVYYRTWDGATVPTEGWLMLTGGNVHVREHIQFAIRHNSNSGDWTTVVAAAYFYLQYTLRTESADNVQITNAAAGSTISYNLEFMINPAISIMGQDLRPGDYWQFTAQTTAGFTIKFYDSSGQAKAARFDWIANGYGTKRK